MTATADMRKYQREYARRVRARKLATAMRGRTTCPKRHGPGVCGAVLEDRVLPGGRVVTTCPACERAKRGLCRDCGQPVEGQVRKALRCRECKRLRQRACERQYREHHREELRRKAREAYQLHPDVRDRKNRQKVEWRKRNPMRVAMHKRKARLEGRGGRKTREAHLEYHRKYNAARAAEKREYMKQRATWYGKSPTCRQCGSPVAFAGVGRPRLDCMGCRPARAA